ncbi:hypothetical protein [Argonema antarcticum]|uniref:hypothetical protein n=1 Tax=Argonema antarcticum TaxID=2942763 RepID=UPI0020111175|nr:hypothetical protein [Argonema antarcticum]MCL1471546.1 hypothetical protein [Argonema antarcticum A004/B2]
MQTNPLKTSLENKDRLVVQTSKQKVEIKGDRKDFPVLPDPALLQAARQIYRAYSQAHPKLVERPIGVAINRITLRGKLIFANKPILLPQESFVPFSQIESELY